MKFPVCNINAGLLSGFRIIYILFVPLLVLHSCKVSYSFSGANTGNLETVSVQYFANRASIVKPTLSQYFTDELRDICQRQTDLRLVSDMGQANFEGEIRTYSTRPVAISGTEQASLSRFSITIRVKFTNSLNPELDFDQSFTHYEDYDSSQSLDAVEGELTELIIERIVEDIFNRAFVNW
jgi:hypothetical protein